ncbi:MAG: holo-ACP synthase [Syntrophomonadaceae bacterium]|jgi:holo-[acyl-carrier protein] synthase|nr:holo-ACP synthase [Syntrophomonadaceae bacterium]
MVGVDIIDIEKFKCAVLRTPRLINRLFTPSEISYCLSRKNSYPSMAARFAAKEAIRKLHHLMITKVSFQDLEVIVDINGKPGVTLHGQAHQHAELLGIADIRLSLSHTQNQAIAIACAQKG